MKYTVKTETVSEGEHVIDVDLPLGLEDPELTDRMVRAQAKDAPHDLATLIAGERITEVWRDGVRIYPRAKQNRKAKPVEKEKEKPDWANIERDEEAVA